MGKKTIILLLAMCFLRTTLQAQDSYATLINNYVTLLNDWFKEPSNYTKMDKLVEICKKCKVRDTIVIKYSARKPIDISFERYLNIFKKEIYDTKKGLVVKIVCMKTFSDKGRIFVNTILKYNGAIALTTICNFWILNGNISKIESTDYITLHVKEIKFLLKPVEGGQFQMGHRNGDKTDEPDENEHIVDIDSYYICDTEITQGLWKAIMGTCPSDAHRTKDTLDNYPVENVSWDTIQSFIAKINQITKLQFRLPTEKEWEYAAHGGNVSKSYKKYSGSNNIDSVAWYGHNNTDKMKMTYPVKQKKANELGLYDMSGNVWEWCQDWYNKDYNGEKENPYDERVIRGGSWNSNARHCRVINRTPCEQEYHSNEIGFRLVLSFD